MNRFGLILAAFSSLVLTGTVLPRTGWMSFRASANAETQAHTPDPMASEAVWRWRHCEPNHWRACLLQR